MSQKYWSIVGHSGTSKIYECKVKLGAFSEKKIQEVLKALVAKAALEYSEIVGAYASKTVLIRNELLTVQVDVSHQTYTCGYDPYFTAKTVEEES